MVRRRTEPAPLDIALCTAAVDNSARSEKRSQNVCAILWEWPVIGIMPARRTTKPRIYGHTPSGREITDAEVEVEVEALAAEAEVGYDVDELIARRAKRGRPALGSAPASVESVRLNPELREGPAGRARAEGTTTSEVIREALRSYVRAG